MTDTEQHARNTCAEVLTTTGFPALADTVRRGGRDYTGHRVYAQRLLRTLLYSWDLTAHEQELVVWALDIAERMEI